MPLPSLSSEWGSRLWICACVGVASRRSVYVPHLLSEWQARKRLVDANNKRTMRASEHHGIVLQGFWTFCWKSSEACDQIQGNQNCGWIFLSRPGCNNVTGNKQHSQEVIAAVGDNLTLFCQPFRNKDSEGGKRTSTCWTKWWNQWFTGLGNGIACNKEMLKDTRIQCLFSVQCHYGYHSRCFQVLLTIEAMDLEFLQKCSEASRWVLQNCLSHSYFGPRCFS